MTSVHLVLYLLKRWHLFAKDVYLRASFENIDFSIHPFVCYLSGLRGTEPGPVLGHGEPMAHCLQPLLQPHLLLEQLIITLSCRSTRYRTLTCTTTRRASSPSSTARPPTSPPVGTADHNSILQEYTVQNLDLYYDTESQWPFVYSSSSNLTSCWNS
jgi:hypothetical protein